MSEARSEALVDGFDLRRETVGGYDDLLIELVEGVEDIEEFLLGFFFADDELEIIDDEAVEGAEFLTKFFTFATANGVNEIGIKVGDGGVENLELWVAV